VPSKREGGIDALRGVAIALVLVYHAGPLAWRLPTYEANGWLSLPAFGWKWLLGPFWHFGFTGVHAFFVLSGFCIHLRAARHPEPLDLRSYALRRFWRIYPPYWIALFAFGVLGKASLGDLALHAGMLHTLNERSFFSINPAFWSLATEEQFYLAYPLVLGLLPRLGIRRVLAASLALSLAWRMAVLSLVPPTVDNFMAWRVLVHGLFLPRWFDWLLGCWLAELSCAPGQPLRGRARPLALAGGALLLLAMATRLHVVADKLLSDVLFSSGYAAITGAILGARPARLKIARTFVLFLQALGRRAYGLYLVHQPLLDWGRLATAVRLPLAVAAGWTFSLVCERPFEKRSQRVLRRASAQAAPDLFAQKPHPSRIGAAGGGEGGVEGGEVGIGK
jgi:peptidoglycan/LPS O-acetylase OafA/YrhL